MMPMLRQVRHHKIVHWIVQHKTTIAIILGLIVLVVAGIWFWGVLVGYVNPEEKGATNRKDVVQAYALIVAGVVAAIGGIVGIVNVQTSRRNLQQQRELEEQRAQEDALQAYFEQMGDLLTDHNLISTDREDLQQLARAQTLTVSGRLNQDRKGQLLLFLYGAGLINRDKPVVDISGADYSAADLSGANLRANLFGANLTDANLTGANLSYVKLSDATVTEKQLAECKSLIDATMPNGQKYEDWLKMNN
jgi:flagellar basal body-associated protein FliL